MAREDRPVLKAIQRRLKPLETANRDFWLRVLRRRFDNRKLEHRLDPKSVRRVLFLRYDMIGDMIVTLPLFALLKRLNPEISIDVLASPRNAAIVRDDPNVSRVFLLRDRPDRFVRDIRRVAREHYDVIFCCLFAKSSKIGIIANLIGDDDTVKVTRWRGERYTMFFNVQSTAKRHMDPMWEQLLHMVPATFDHDLRDEDFQPYIAVDEASRRRAHERLKGLGVNPGEYILLNLSAQQRNQWTLEGYAAAIRAVLERYPGERFVINAMKKDEATARALLDVVDDHRVVLYPPTGSIQEVVEVVGSSRAVFSPDTSVVHMASARKRPVLALYRKGQQIDWAPYRVPNRMVVSSNDWVPNIPIDEVVPRFLDLLEDIARGHDA